VRLADLAQDRAEERGGFFPQPGLVKLRSFGGCGLPSNRGQHGEAENRGQRHLPDHRSTLMARLGPA